MAPTDASTLQPSQIRRPIENLATTNAEDENDYRSQTSYATTVRDDDRGSQLKPPKLQDITQVIPFECPYCWTIQDIKSERMWRLVDKTSVSAQRKG